MTMRTFIFAIGATVLAVCLGGCQTGIYHNLYTTSATSTVPEKSIAIDYKYYSLLPLKGKSVASDMKQRGGDIAIGAAASEIDSSELVSIPASLMKVLLDNAAKAALAVPIAAAVP
jgi:hypothetical protein